MADKIYYITKDKFNEVQKEYQNLLAAEHKKASGEIPKIFESEDLNTEFVDYQEDMDFLRAKISELHDIIKHHEIIKIPPKAQQHVVGMGAKVVAAVGHGQGEFTIVGTLEADPASGRISNESPVGKALMGRKVGDEIVIESPKKTTYKILKVSYHVS